MTCQQIIEPARVLDFFYLFLWGLYWADLYFSELTDEMHFPLDNSVCRVEATCPLVRLDN